jgi:hypothetical protein
MDIHSSIASFETMTWSEIEKKVGPHGTRHNHPMPVSDICPDARKRLRELVLDDFDTLYSLRITGERRLWGIRDNEAFYILWWDPHHSVCPVKKRYT